VEIVAIASESLSEFPVNSILSSITLCSHGWSKKDRRLLETLITAESNDMGRSLIKGVADDGDATMEEKRLESFQKSIIHSVKEEIKAGRMKSSRKIALSYMSVIDIAVGYDKNLFAIKEISALIKNMSMDSIWQVWTIPEYLESFWLNHLGKIYDNLDLENHPEKVSTIESFICITYSAIVDKEFQNSSSPQTTANLLYCIGCI
jgi:hypothetical protein